MRALPLPKDVRSVNPYLVVADVQATLDFAETVFGAEVTERLEADGRISHAQMRIGDATVMVGSPYDGTTTTAHVYVYVDDCDAAYARALAAGAESIMSPAVMFYGDRHGGVRDGNGTTWWIATHIEDVDSAELERRHREMFGRRTSGPA